MRYHEPWTLFPRKFPPSGKNPKGITLWYYRARKPDGTRTTPFSTGCTTKSAARDLCRRLEQEGKLIQPSRAEMRAKKYAPTPVQDMTFSDLARDFWNWGADPKGTEGSEWVKMRLKFGDPRKPPISKHYCDAMARTVELHILPNFRHRLVREITPQEIEAFALRLRDEKQLSGKSVNNVISCMRTMLVEAHRAGVLPWDASEKRKIRALGHAKKSRGRLTFAEVRRLFGEGALKKYWNGHSLYFTINLVAAATGCRQGELLALRDRDVFPDHLHIEHSYDAHYGLKGTKTGEVRDVPLPDRAFKLLKPLLGSGGYVFSQNGGKIPCAGNLVTEALYTALDAVGIKNREERNITFHSWRHWLNSTLRVKGIPDPLVRRITGHATEDMTENYSEFLAEDFAAVAQIQSEVFK